MSILAFIEEASLVVQIVLAVLVLASLYSWVLIFAKVLGIGRVVQKGRAFGHRFSRSDNLTDLYRQVKAHKEKGKAIDPMEDIFYAGFREFLVQVQQRGLAAEDALSHIQRQMRLTYNRHIEALSDRTSALATIGSVAPYIGLLGTVWGILTSFQALGQIRHATLTMVAPGISEALIATAIGLCVAIPAVVAYNRFINQIELLSAHYEAFMDESAGVLLRHLQAGAPIDAPHE